MNEHVSNTVTLLMMFPGALEEGFYTKFATCPPNNAVQYITMSALTCRSHEPFIPPKHSNYLFFTWTQIDIPCPD